MSGPLSVLTQKDFDETVETAFGLASDIGATARGAAGSISAALQLERARERSAAHRERAALMQLVEKWRADAKTKNAHGSGVYSVEMRAKMYQLLRCADELSARLHPEGRQE